jgi:hypothetical protein
MNQDQESAFTKYGCASRCLLVLAQAMGNPITKDWFIKHYSKKYPFWISDKSWGLTDTGIVIDIAKDVGLGRSFQIFIDKKKVREKIKNEPVNCILLLTEKCEKEDGSLHENFHCSLVWKPDKKNKTKEAFEEQVDGDFSVSQVSPDLKPTLPPDKWSDAEIERVGGYFLLIGD